MEYLELDPRDIAVLMTFARKYGISLYEACEIASGLDLENAEISVRPAVSRDGNLKLSQFVSMVHRHLGMVKKESAGQILYYFLQDSGMLAQFTSYKTIRDERVAAN